MFPKELNSIILGYCKPSEDEYCCEHFNLFSFNEWVKSRQVKTINNNETIVTVDDMLWCVDGPAVYKSSKLKKYWPDKDVKDRYNEIKEYWIKGKKHREEGPAIIIDIHWSNFMGHRTNGSCYTIENDVHRYIEEYWINGVLHKDNTICIDTKTEYTFQGMYRSNGTSKVSFYKNGILVINKT